MMNHLPEQASGTPTYSVTPIGIPTNLLRRPYRPLTASDRLRIERDMNGVLERLNALLATGGAHA